MLFNQIDRNNNMAVVRYYLSYCVLIAHTATLAGIQLPWSNHSYVAVGSFFVLSGFLIFSSFEKSASVGDYFERRARRIMPPYVLIVLLCAVGLVAVSTLAPKDYYADAGFWKYLAANLSFMNFVHPDLPGVFNGPEFYTSAVNGSLWTMKGEWACYLSVPVIFALICKFPRRKSAIMMVLIALSLAMRYGLYELEESSGNRVYGILAKQFDLIFSYFLVGALINLHYHLFLKYKWPILAISLGMVIFSDTFFAELYYAVLRPFVIGALVIWFSQVGKWGYFMRNHEDLSYDMYLFHAPIIQLMVVFGVPQMVPPAVTLLIVTAATLLLAYASWNLVGKRFKKKSKRTA